VTFTNKIGADVVTPAAATIVSPTLSSSSNLNAGSYAQNVSSTLGGADSGNYMLTGGFTTATNNYTVNPLALTAAIGAVTTTYGTPAATGTVTLTNKIAGDVVTPAAATIVSPVLSSSSNLNAGSYAQNVSSTLGGADGGNYTLTGGFITATNNYTVNKLALTVGAIGVNKVYDALTTGTVVLSDTRIPGDVIATTSAASAFNNPNVGNAKPVSVSGISISGVDAGNYTNNTTAATTASITPAPLTVTANSQTKTFGTTLTFAGTEFTSTGLVAGETVGSTTLFSTGAVGTAPVAGSPYAITVSAATGGTFAASNYGITYVNGALSVTPSTTSPLTGITTINGRQVDQLSLLQQLGVGDSAYKLPDCGVTISALGGEAVRTAAISALGQCGSAAGGAVGSTLTTRAQ
jgi:hypothetical protein